MPFDASTIDECPGGALFCDDFETGDFSRWDGIIANNAVSLQTMPVHAGTWALAATASVGEKMRGVEKGVTVAAGQTLAAREWVRFPMPVQDGETTMKFSADSGYLNHHVDAYCNEVSMWGMSENSPTAGFHDHESTTPCVLNTWQCVELVYTLSTPPHAQLFVDGQLAYEDDMLDASPTFSLFAVGAGEASSDGFSTFTDNVALSNQRIGCP